MKIVLCTIPDSIEKRLSSSLSIKKGFLPPLGLGYIAAVLEKAGHEILIVDAPVLKMKVESLSEYIVSLNPEIIGLSILTPAFEKSVALAKLIKSKISVPIIVGGPHSTILPVETLESCAAIDIAVIGEGEVTMLELTESWKGKRWSKPLEDIKGISFRAEDGRVIRTPPRERIKDLDSLPFPSRHLFERKLYMPLPNQYKRLPVTSIMASRGCPYAKCKHCFQASSLMGPYRRRSVKNVIGEVRFLVDNYGIREICFRDDAFTFDESWVLQFCKLLKEEKLGIVWSGFGMITTVTKDLLAVMSEAGCWNIFYGIESGVQDLLDKLNRGYTLERIKKVIQWTKDVGIEIRGSFMLGIPGETPELAEETIKFAIALDIDYAIFALATPFPNTEFCDICKDEGTLEIDFNKYTCFEPIFVPKGYSSKEELKAVQQSAMRRFYYRPGYIFKTLKKMRSFEDMRRMFNGLVLSLGMTREILIRK